MALGRLRVERAEAREERMRGGRLPRGVGEVRDCEGQRAGFENEGEGGVRVGA